MTLPYENPIRARETRNAKRRRWRRQWMPYVFGTLILLALGITLVAVRVIDVAPAAESSDAGERSPHPRLFMEVRYDDGTADYLFSESGFTVTEGGAPVTYEPSQLPHSFRKTIVVVDPRKFAMNNLPASRKGNVMSVTLSMTPLNVKKKPGTPNEVPGTP